MYPNHTTRYVSQSLLVFATLLGLILACPASADPGSGCDLPEPEAPTADVYSSCGDHHIWLLASTGYAYYEWQSKPPGSSTWVDFGDHHRSQGTWFDDEGAWRFRYRGSDDFDCWSDWSNRVKVTLFAMTDETPEAPAASVEASCHRHQILLSASPGNGYYEWQYKSPGSSAWIDFGGQEPWAATWCYDEGAWRFRYRWSDNFDCWSEWSDRVLVTVSAPTAEMPDAPTASIDSDYNCTVISLSGLAGSAYYEWQYKSPGSSIWQFFGHDGQMQWFLCDDAGTWRFRYRCNDEMGCLSDWSDKLKFTVPATSEDAPDAPTASIQTFCNNHNIRLSVSTNYAYFYEWQYKAPGSSTWIDFGGGTPLELFRCEDDGTWRFRYRCLDNLGYWSDWSSRARVTLSAMTDETPEAPAASVYSTCFDHEISLSASGGYAYYEWQYMSPESSTWADFGSHGQTERFWCDHESTWRFRYRWADHQDCPSDWSDRVAVTVSARAEEAPEAPTASIDSGYNCTEILLSASTGYTRYVWQYRSPGSSTWRFCSGNGQTQSFLCDDEGTWRFRYRGTNDLGCDSDWSESVRVTVHDIPREVPEAPTANLSASADPLEVLLSASPGYAHYEWQYKAPGSSTWVDFGVGSQHVFFICDDEAPGGSATEDRTITIAGPTGATESGSRCTELGPGHWIQEICKSSESGRTGA